MVTTNVENLCVLGQGPDLRLLQVLGLVLVGSSKVGAHAAVVAGDDNTTLSSGLDIVNTVFSAHTGLLASIPEKISVVVLANAANVDDRVVGEQVLHTTPVSSGSFTIRAYQSYLSTTGSVLSGTTGNQLSIALQQLFVDTHVLVLCEDSVVVLEPILLQEGGVTGID